MTKSLNGKVALVTDAEEEVGAAVASRLVDEGALVVVGAHRMDAVGTRRDDDPGSHDLIELDGGDPDAVARAVAGIVERHGRLDVLVNAAGSMPSQALAEPGPGNRQPDGKQPGDKQPSDKQEANRPGDGKDGSGDGAKPDGKAPDKKPMPRGKKSCIGPLASWSWRPSSPPGCCTGCSPATMRRRTTPTWTATSRRSRRRLAGA